MRGSFWTHLIVIAVSTLIGVGAAVAQSFSTQDKVIHPGISIGGIKVGGLTRNEAANKLERQIDNIDPIVVTYAAKHWEAKPRTLGIEIDIDKSVEKAYQSTRKDGIFMRARENLRTESGVTFPVEKRVDEKKLKRFIDRISRDVQISPKNPEIDPSDGGLKVSNGHSGIFVDREETEQAILSATSQTKRNVELKVEKIEPQFNKKELKSLKPAGSFTTTVRHEDSNRLHNIRVATQLVNGTILRPNQVFSFNSAANNFQTVKKYKVATVILNQAPNKAVGGGICQVSSTLYNSALQSGFKIVERHHHSVPVDDGVPLGRDAVIAKGAFDLKFKNNNSISVITGKFDGQSITFKIFSQKPPSGEIIVKTEKKRIKPPAPVITNNPDLPEGEIVRKREARPGFRVFTQRIVKAPSGEVTKQRVSEDLFPPQGTLIIVGTKETNPEVLRIMVRK